MQQAKKVIIESVQNIWEGFLAQSPLLAGGFILLAFTWFAAFIAVKLARKALSKSSMRGSLCSLILRLIKISIWLIGIVTAATVVFPGLTPAKALSAAGLVSVAVGLAFKDIFQNFFAGVMLLWKFPFEKGDVISCGDVKGRIKEIELRHTQIQDTSGELIILPNSMLVTEPVEIITYEDTRRIELDVGVSYGTDLEQATKTLTEAVESADLVDNQRGFKILPVGFGSSSIDYKIFAWAPSGPMEFREAQAELICKIKSALDNAGIEIPFPYRTLTFSEPLQMTSSGEHSD